MDKLETARDRLILTRDLGHDAVRALMATDGLERIGTGTYLKPDPGWEAWLRVRIIHLARLVVALERQPDTLACLTSSAVLWDLPIWQSPTTVEIWAGKNRWRRGVDLPCSMGKDRSSSTGKKNGEILRRHAYAIDLGDRTTEAGLPTLTLERLAVDVALQWHPRDALVTVDGIFRHFVAPDRRDRTGSEARADALRVALLERLESLGRRRGSVQARAVLKHATAWSESPGESVVRWMTLALGLPTPVSQWAFARTNGHLFYLDLFWEAFKTCLEFDGTVKYRGDQPVGVIMQEKQRDDEIRRTGIGVIHLDTATVNDTPRFVDVLRRSLPVEMWTGVRPRSGLWTSELAPWRC
ncbi:MAG: hypothetical protein ACQERF_06005 [Actinomycetota bacterium]